MKFATFVSAITLLYTGALLLATHLPVQHAPQTGEADKMIHFIAYFLLALLVNFQLFVTKKWTRVSPLLTILFISILAGLDELTQPFVGRIGDWKDWRSDFFGIVSGTYLFMFVILFLWNHPFVQKYCRAKHDA